MISKDCRYQGGKEAPLILPLAGYVTEAQLASDRKNQQNRTSLLACLTWHPVARPAVAAVAGAVRFKTDDQHAGPGANQRPNTGARKSEP